MGVPRPPIQLVQDKAGSVRVVDVKHSDKDYTDVLASYSRQVADSQMDGISAYIFKKGSPCGTEEVKVYNPKGGFLHQAGVGVFADSIKQQYPVMPVEDEEHINDSDKRENFLIRVYVYHDWQKLISKGITPSALVDFHESHKYLLMVHDHEQTRVLGQLAAKAGHADIENLAQDYICGLMEILKQHTVFPHHIRARLINDLDNEYRHKLLESILGYQSGEVPLVVPMTLLRCHGSLRKAL